MSVDRLCVTVPVEIGDSLRALAQARGETVSTIVTEAIARELRLEALDRALAEADRRFGPIPSALVDRVESEILASRGQAARRCIRKLPRRRRNPG